MVCFDGGMTTEPVPLSYLNSERASSILAADSPHPIKRQPSWMIRSLATDQDHRCLLCTATLKQGRVDFIVPTEVGGWAHRRDNLALFCSRCVRTRAHRDLLACGMDVPSSLLEKRRDLWLDLPHHLLPIGRGRSPAVVREALLGRADHPRVRYTIDFTPDMVWIGGRAHGLLGVVEHLDVLAQHGPLVRDDWDGVRMWGLPIAAAPKALAALAEAGGYLVPLVPSSESWAALLTGEAAHRRRTQNPNGEAWPVEGRVLSMHPRAVADREATRRRRIRQLLAERGELTTRMGQARDVPLILAALVTERDRVDQRLVGLRCECPDAS
jgi:hypothetical protein